MTTNKCGSCTACCRVFAITTPQLDKPAGKWCEHCAIGKGCKIYDDRPSICVNFECIWLQSQDDDSVRLAPELRPDRCKVVLSGTTNPNFINACTMPGADDAWKRPAIRAFIQRIVNGGAAVVVGPPNSTTKTVITPDGIHERKMTPPDKDGMQWSI